MQGGKMEKLKMHANKRLRQEYLKIFFSSSIPGLVLVYLLRPLFHPFDLIVLVESCSFSSRPVARAEEHKWLVGKW